MYTYEVCTLTEMEERVKKLRMDRTEQFSIPKYEGFRYFSPDHIFNSRRWNRPHLPEDRFILAYENKKLIGVCLIQKSPDEENLWWVSYIDVHRAYKRKGVATNLYAKLNEWVTPELVIIGSSLSPEGKEANLHELRKRIIKRCRCFADMDEYWVAPNGHFFNMVNQAIG